jgi:hypothetical protein
MALGRADPDRMLREMSARQLFEWFAFDVLEGFGERRADLRMGILASLTANVHRDVKRKVSPYKPSDFIPKIKEDADKIAERELKMALDSISKRKK